MRINLDSDALAKGTLVNPAWYPCKLSKYREEPAQTDRSTNAICSITILAGDFKGSGAERHQICNEKAMGFAKSLLLALGAKKKKAANGGEELDAELNAQTVNDKLVDVYFVRGVSNKGNEFNQAKDFAPIGTNTGYKAA